MICTADGIESGVAVRRDFPDLLYGYILTDHGVEFADQAVGIGQRRPGIEMGHHHAGVDPGIGAAGAGNLHRPAQNHRQSVLKHQLDRHLARL